MGGATDEERWRICEYLVYKVSVEFEGLLHKKGPSKTITVKKLLTAPAFFATQQRYMLLVDQHVLYVQTNKMKRKLWVADQRGKLLGTGKRAKSRGARPLVS